MKILKKILGIIVFFGIGVGLFVSISYMLRPTNNDFFRKDFTGFYAEKEDSIDIVALGSSALYRYFNNPYLWSECGITSYDLATASQSVFLTGDLIDEVYKTQSPDLIVIEVRKFPDTETKTTNSKRFPMVYNNMKYSLNRIQLINSVVDEWPERIDAYFDIITYHDAWEEFSYENLKYIDNESAHDLKGWKIVEEVESIERPIINADETVSPISEEAEKALIQIMEKCKKEKIPVLFLATPWQVPLEEQKMNRYMGNLIEEYGFPFLDCNLYTDEIGLDYDKDFYDPKHVNIVGSEKVTKFIGDYIKENYNISTDHEEDVKKDWNQMLELYHTRANDAKAQVKAKTAE